MFGDGAKHRQVSVPAADLAALAGAVAKAKESFKMPTSARVVSCYEAGRDGFWLHRHLVSIGIENHVVDAASIDVSRRLALSTFQWWRARLKRTAPAAARTHPTAKAASRLPTSARICPARGSRVGLERNRYLIATTSCQRPDSSRRVRPRGRKLTTGSHGGTIPP